MKKLFLSLAAAAVLLLPLSAHAYEKTGIYVAPKYVLSVQKTDSNTYGYPGNLDFDTSNTCNGGAIAVGYDFSRKLDLPVRAELEYAVYGSISKNNDYYSDVDTKIGFKTLMLNVYGDIGTWYGFTPYVGAGIGMAWVKNEYGYTRGSSNPYSHTFSNTDKVLAGQIGLGCSYAFNNTVSVDLGYRLLLIDSKDHTSYGPAPSGYPHPQAEHTLKNKESHAHQLVLGIRFTF